jgi:hypothetical protein
MRSRNISFMLVIVFSVLVVSLACVGGTTTVTTAQPPAPVQTQLPQQPQVTQPPQATQLPQGTDTAQGLGGLTTFTDKNNYFQIQVPSDWKYEQTTDKKNNYYYIDTFTSPDDGAVVESIVYDDGTPFTGNDKSKFSLYLLNTFYSKTGQEGDIRVSDDSIQKDGSERLTWTSKGGGYSGISFLETRGSTTFLFFTVDWGNSVKDQYFDTLDKVVSSYTTP